MRGEGIGLVTFSNDKRQLDLQLLFLTHRLASLVTLCWWILSLPFSILGSEKETDPEVAAGIWKYRLPCLFSSIQGCAAAVLTWVISRAYQLRVEIPEPSRKHLSHDMIACVNHTLKL